MEEKDKIKGTDNCLRLLAAGEPPSEWHHANFLKCIHLNGQSILNKIDLLQAETTWQDVIVVMETWLREEDNEDDLIIPGYHKPIRKDRTREPGAGRGGGVAVYVKDHLAVKRMDDLDIEELEALWVEVNTGRDKILIGGMYRDPGKRVQHWDLVEQSFEQAKMTNNKHILIMGDLNDNQAVRGGRLEKLCRDYNLHQLIKEETHNKAILDVIISSSPDIVRETEVASQSLSKHRAVKAILNFRMTPSSKIRRRIYEYDKADWKALNQDIEREDWEVVLGEKTADDMAEKWTRKYKDLINKHIPTKDIYISRDDAPWITSKLKKAMKGRNGLYRDAKKKDTEAAWKKYKEERNKVIDDIREAKKLHIEKTEQKINDAATCNDKLWWKLVKDVLNKQRKANSPPLEKADGYATSSEEKANLFNEHFARQSSLDDQGKIPDTNDIPLADATLENISMNTLGIKKIIQNLNVTKASGGDGISPRVLRETANSISPSITRMFNFCFQTGHFPKAWKRANVTPLYKNKGERSHVKNYRPVSLLSCVGKVMERAIFEAMFKHLQDNKLLTKFQAAYLPGSSTETQVLEMYHRIVEAMDRGKDIRFLFLDVSRAFDRVWHSGVLAKLKRYGFNGRLLKWLENYLTDRQQRVVVEGAQSTYVDITAGVPQGSILGPLLFLIYVNDLPTSLQTNIRIYADDTTLFLDYKDPEAGREQLQRDIEKLEVWAEKWLMEFSPAKTESLVFSRKRVKHEPEIKMAGKNIKSVKQHKHLGILLQQNGKWSGLIDDIVGKAKKKVDILRGMMYKLNRRSLQKLYLCFIRPGLEYGSTIWDSCTDQEKLSLESVQLAAMRAITGAKRGTSHGLLYADTCIETLQARRDRRKIIQMYKIQKKQSPEVLRDLLPETTLQRTERSLRSHSNTSLIKCNTSAFDSSFLPSTIKKWNELPEDIRAVKSVEHFKERITPKRSKVPEILYFGERKPQILQARMRLRCSNLNEDLHSVNLAESPMCRCGEEIEDAEHFLMDCALYREERRNLEVDLRHYDTEELLMGNPHLTQKQNEKMFSQVHKFINTSGRFRN